MVAHWIPSSDELTVYTSTQIPHFVRTFLAICCNVSEAKVRVVAPDVGGGFGSKLNCYAEEFIAAAVSRKVGAPVKWIEERSEAMTATIHGRAQDAHMELAATRDGKILGLRAHYVQDCGSYLQLLTPDDRPPDAVHGAAAPTTSRRSTSPSPRCSPTPTPTDAYRGAGRPEATHAIERIMDILAPRSGSAARRCAAGTSSPSSRTPTATGLIYDSGEYTKTLDRLQELCGSQEDVRGAQSRRPPRAASCWAAGISTYVEICGLAPSAVTHAIGLTPGGWETSTVRVHPTGKVTVITGTSPHGQGHATSWSQIVESELGIPFDDVEVIHGDTAFAPYGLGTYGSRSLAVGGTAVYRAAGQVRDKAKAVAAHMLEASPDDLEFDDGTFRVKGSPDKSLGIGEVAFRAWQGFDMPERLRPRPGRDGVPRSAQLHLPVRRARLPRSRSTATPARSRSCATSPSTTAATWSTR